MSFIKYSWIKAESNLKKKLILKYNFLELITGYQLRWHMPPKLNQKAILTFDDGPLPNTLNILDALAKYNIKAWFFMVGSRMTARPDIVNKVLEQGHSIYSHAFHHLFMSFLPLQDFIQDVKKSMDILKRMTNSSEKIFRPPNGNLNKLQIAWLLFHGFKIIYWSHQWHNKIVESWPSILPSAPIMLLHDYDDVESVEKGIQFVTGYNASRA